MRITKYINKTRKKKRNNQIVQRGGVVVMAVVGIFTIIVIVCMAIGLNVSDGEGDGEDYDGGGRNVNQKQHGGRTLTEKETTWKNAWESAKNEMKFHNISKQKFTTELFKTKKESHEERLNELLDITKTINKKTDNKPDWTLKDIYKLMQELIEIIKNKTDNEPDYSTILSKINVNFMEYINKIFLAGGGRQYLQLLYGNKWEHSFIKWFVIDNGMSNAVITSIKNCHSDPTIARGNNCPAYLKNEIDNRWKCCWNKFNMGKQLKVTNNKLDDERITILKSMVDEEQNVGTVLQNLKNNEKIGPELTEKNIDDFFKTEQSSDDNTLIISNLKNLLEGFRGGRKKKRSKKRTKKRKSKRKKRTKKRKRRKRR